MNTLSSKVPPIRRLAAVVTLAAAFMAGQASAEPTDEPPTLTVNFADLDLSKPAGAETLYQRIRAAARTVCGGTDHRHDMRNLRYPRRAIRNCYEHAVADALQQVNNSNLFEVAVAAR